MEDIKADGARVRLVVIDEQALFRAGICMLLAGQPSFAVLGEAGSRAQAIPLVKREQPDVILLGVDRNDGKNLDFLPEIFEVSEASRVLILSGAADSELHSRAVYLGAIGVLSKDITINLLVEAIEKVNAGEVWLDGAMTANILRELSARNRARKKDPEEAKIASLTKREREIIQLVGQGFKNKQIAERLFISNITVHHHLTSIYSKLDVSDHLELLIYAYRSGLAEMPRSFAVSDHDK
jgi:two-component system, NarL family, nitrate/nitrite response regulator NarL